MPTPNEHKLNMLIEEQILCIVGGHGMNVSVPRYRHALLKNLKGHLLCKMDHPGSDPDQWEFRDESGKLLADGLLLWECNIPVEGKLYLSLKPGVGA